MYGLEKTTDLGFLIGKSVLRVISNEFQAQLHFEADAFISIEGRCKLDGEVIEYEGLGHLRNTSVVETSIGNDGSILLVFADGQRLEIEDSNEHYESYQITAPGVTIIV